MKSEKSEKANVEYLTLTRGTYKFLYSVKTLANTRKGLTLLAKYPAWGDK